MSVDTSERVAAPITVTASPSVGETAHHVGSPPTGFHNPWPSYQSHGDWFALLKARFGPHAEKNFVPVPQGPDGARSDELVAVRTPDWGIAQGGCLRATWIGHASFLIETPAAPGAARGIRILCDPVWSERTSPVQWLGPKRYTPPPCALDELPDVDLVCISHDHYDHLDHATVQHIYRTRNRHVHFLVGRGNKQWFTRHVCPADHVTEWDWWDGGHVRVDGLGSVEVTCCPAQHFSGRTAFNHGRTLWCGWAFAAGGKKLYFAGDTAYQAAGTPAPCPAFAAVGRALGPFDLALLPIGLMTPHSFMGHVHATPEQSLRIHADVRARLSIGMHYGTVRGGLSAHFEDVRDPPRRWRVAAEKEGLWRGGGVEGSGEPVDVTEPGVGLCDIGETVAV